VNHGATTSGSGESGFVLVAVAALLVVLMGFLALGVTTGYLYSARTTAQEIGDGAALAGAYTYISSPLDPTPGATAEYHAEQFALARADILGVTLDPTDVVATADVPNRRVHVRVDTTQPTFFATVMGVNSADISTVSIAEAGHVAAGETCTRPFFIPNDVFIDPGDPPTYCDDCMAADGGQMLVYNQAGPGLPADYVPTAFAMNVINPGVAPDNQFRLYPGSPGGAIAPGQYYLIDLVPGENAGADDIADWIRGCDPDVNRTECAELYSVKTGGTGGGIKNGLFGNGSMDGLLPDPPDTYDMASGHFFLGGDSGSPSNSSVQAVIAPIWDVCDATTVGDYCTTGSIGTGTNVAMPIVGFAYIFLEGPDNGPGNDDVTARLLGVTGCGEQTGTGDDEEPDGSTVLSLPLRLVNDPGN
jgi:hypothetical protein